MESETIEQFLKKLGYEKYIELFIKNEINLDLLKELSENNVKETLKEIGLILGVRMRILQELQNMKANALPKHIDRTGDDVAAPENPHPIEEHDDPDHNWRKDNSHSIKSDITSVTPEEVRIVLLGKTGCGKSATGNCILGSRKFTSLLSGISVTSKCCIRNATRFNKKIVIVDTPGIFDTKESNDKIQEEIFRCIGMSSPGPHAFLLVLPVTSRFTPEEEQTIQHFIKHFGKDIFKYFIVLFTRKAELDENEITLKRHIEHSPLSLRTFVDKCGERAFAIENTLKGEEQDKQVGELLNMILKNVEKNQGEYYTNKDYEKAESEIKKIEEIRSKSYEKEFQSIKDQILKKYEQIAEEKTKNLRKLQNQLHFEIQNQKEKENRVATLTKQVEEYEQKLKDSKDSEKEDFQLTLDMLRKEVAKRKAEESEGAYKIKQLRKRNEEAEEYCEKLLEKQDEETENAYRNFKDKNKSKIRDELREEMESWPVRIVKQGLAMGVSYLSKLFNY